MGEDTLRTLIGLWLVCKVQMPLIQYFFMGKFSHMLATKKSQCEFYKGVFLRKKYAKLLDFEGKKAKSC
jgi:hypothetical protein